MIGRGAFAGPWVFRMAWAAQLGEDPAGAEPTEDEKLDVVLAYFERMRAYRTENYAMHKIRQKISWLGKTINASHCGPLKQGVRESRTPDEVIAAVEAWRANAAGRAPALRSTV
jgi:tRNA-dihydrouridine synthase